MSVLHDILIYVLEPLFVVKNDDMFSGVENMTSAPIYLTDPNRLPLL
jgi:hypothetical protein